jgi:hypothetical protein
MSGDDGNKTGAIEGLLTHLDALTEPVDYTEYAPKNCDVKSFIDFTHGIIRNFKGKQKHRPPGAVEKNLNKLRSLLSNMKDDLRIELISRECQDLKENQFEEFKNIILNGGSALEKLEHLTKEPFKWGTRRDHMDQKILFNLAIANFKHCGGTLSSKLNSDLLHYLDAIAEAAEIDDFDASKAVQKYKKL